MEDVSITARMKSRRGIIIGAFLAALLISAVAVALAWANNPQGKTTAKQRIVPASNDPGFRQLKLGPGEGRMVRQGGIGVAKPGRAARRSSLAYFGQLSDFQLADEECPARVEFVDPPDGAQLPSMRRGAPRRRSSPRSTTRWCASSIAFAAREPDRQSGNGTRRMDLILGTGDSIDSQQLNETALGEGDARGRTVPSRQWHQPGRPTATIRLRRRPKYRDCRTPPPRAVYRRPGLRRLRRGAGPHFYDPDQPTGHWRDWPSYPGLMDAAQQAFTPPGSTYPSYVAFGNHDGLVQGNQAAKPVIRAGRHRLHEAPGGNGSGRPAFADALTNRYPGHPAQSDGSDPDNGCWSSGSQSPVRDQEAVQVSVSAGGQADGHGFDFIDPGSRRLGR